MKFVDQVRIHVKAGDGGKGAVAFRREKYVEKGGPSGGDGGNGGSVIFIADPQLTTLLDFRYQQHHRAQSGQQGMGSDCNGAGAPDLELKVPTGTLVKDADSGELLCDLSRDGQTFVAAKAGRGGLGNINFAHSTRQTPRFAQDGTPGEERTLVLELKLLADVGLIGFPNAGKSTFISRVSRARPKVADYPFTTLVPQLGMVQYKDDLSFVMADIPGLIEGASEGVGLGHQFLRHVERCRVLIHLVDLSGVLEGRDPVRDWEVINQELLRYSPALAEKPQLLAANKVDLPDARERLEAFRAEMERRGHPVFAISGVTGEGIQSVLDATAQVLFGGAGHPAAVAPAFAQARPAPSSTSPEMQRAEALKKSAGIRKAVRPKKPTGVKRPPPRRRAAPKKKTAAAKKSAPATKRRAKPAAAAKKAGKPARGRKAPARKGR